MWEYKGTSDIDIGKDHGIFAHDFFSVDIETEESLGIIDYYTALWRRFNYYLDEFDVHEDNTELSPNVKTAMVEHDANLCLMFSEEEHKENNIKTRELIMNIKLAEDIYNTFFFHFYFSSISSINVKTYLVQGKSFLKNGFYNAAIEYFTQAIKLDPNDAFLYAERMHAYMKIKDYDKAIEDLTQRIKLNPDNSHAYLAWSIYLYNKSDYDAFIADCSRAIGINPNEAISYMVRGFAYEEKSDYKSAEADYSKALTIEPDNMAIRQLLKSLSDKITNANEQKGNLEKAILNYTESAKINPDDPWPYYNRGKAYSSQGDYDKAIVDFSQSLNIDPSLVSAYTNRGFAYAKKGEIGTAIAEYTQAINLDPRCATAYYYRGNANKEKRLYDNAISDYTKALELDPEAKELNIVAVYKYRGDAYKSKGNSNIEKANEDYKMSRLILDYE
jgi:tetratricopeptide (TPR) repeat protein